MISALACHCNKLWTHDAATLLARISGDRLSVQTPTRNAPPRVRGGGATFRGKPQEEAFRETPPDELILWGLPPSLGLLLGEDGKGLENLLGPSTRLALGPISRQPAWQAPQGPTDPQRPCSSRQSRWRSPANKWGTVSHPPTSQEEGVFKATKATNRLRIYDHEKRRVPAPSARLLASAGER